MACLSVPAYTCPRRAYWPAAPKPPRAVRHVWAATPGIHPWLWRGAMRSREERPSTPAACSRRHISRVSGAKCLAASRVGVVAFGATRFAPSYLQRVVARHVRPTLKYNVSLSHASRYGMSFPCLVHVLHRRCPPSVEVFWGGRLLSNARHIYVVRCVAFFSLESRSLIPCSWCSSYRLSWARS